MRILKEICHLFPECTPEQIAAQLAKIDPKEVKLHRLVWPTREPH